MTVRDQDHLYQILDETQRAILGTVGAGGQPQVVPIVFVRIDDTLWSPVDGKRKSGRPLQRVVNVRRDARVTVLLDHYEADWQRLWWLRLDGEARIVAPEADAARMAISALRAKYPQYQSVEVQRRDAPLLCIQWHNARFWQASARGDDGS